MKKKKNPPNSNLIVRRGHQLHQDRRRGAGAEDLPALGSHGMEQLGQSTGFLQVALLTWSEARGVRMGKEVLLKANCYLVLEFLSQAPAVMMLETLKTKWI